MKTIKRNITVLIIAILTFSCSQAQKVNNLTRNEYSNILIKGINWNEIKNTQGNLNQLKSFIGNDLSITQSSDPNLARTIKNNNIYFYFEDRSDIGNDYELANFVIKSNLISLTIKSKTINIGANISKLRTITILKTKEGEKKIVFGTNWTQDAIWIEFNQLTNIITKIEYILYD